jgi:hypothetical protein
MRYYKARDRAVADVTSASIEFPQLGPYPLSYHGFSIWRTSWTERIEKTDGKKHTV